MSQTSLSQVAKRKNITLNGNFTLLPSLMNKRILLQLQYLHEFCDIINFCTTYIITMLHDYIYFVRFCVNCACKGIQIFLTP